jgi:hypothetical protein
MICCDGPRHFVRAREQVAEARAIIAKARGVTGGPRSLGRSNSRSDHKWLSARRVIENHLLQIVALLAMNHRLATQIAFGFVLKKEGRCATIPHPFLHSRLLGRSRRHQYKGRSRTCPGRVHCDFPAESRLEVVDLLDAS